MTTMTTTEIAAKLRQFNEWRRGDYEPSEQPEPPNPYEVGLVIDAAVEMIDRLEAAESEAIEQARLNGMGAERELALMAKLEAAEKERDAAELMSLALRAKIAEMERQEPVGGHINRRTDLQDHCTYYARKE